MPIIDLGEFCCQGGGRTLDTQRFSPNDMILATQGNGKLIFSPLGNDPVSPRLALVGITPGGQAENFERYLRTMPVRKAASQAAFAGAQTQIKELLVSQGFADYIGVDLSGDLNRNPEIFTTSLVKCCLKVNGSYKYKAPDIAASPEASYCVVNRFVTDIERFSTLEWIVIFGDPGWEAVTTLRVEGDILLNRLTRGSAKVLNFPHFAQNFQQRAIFCLSADREREYLKRNPKHMPYARKARRMRSELLLAMGRRASVA